MRVRVVQTGRRVAPFDDPVQDVLIANRPLSEWHETMLQGFERVDGPPCLEIPDTLFTTHAMLRRFVEQAQGRNAVAVLADSLYATSSTPVQPDVHQVDGGYRFDAVRFVSGGDEPAVDIVLDPEENRFPLTLPNVLGGPTEIGLPKHPLMTIHHWVHVLWANQAASAHLALAQPKWKTALKVLWAWVRSWFSLNKWKVLGKMNTIGKGCDIHPTAVVEGSTLGDNVTIGPYARVVFSTLGNDVSIMSGAEVEASTLGDGAVVAQRSGVRLCVMYPGAFASQVLMQACVLGRNVFTTPGSYSIDLNLDRDIRVPLDGQLYSTGSRFLGSAFGHDARIGAGVWLASGRQIPNGTMAIRDPAKIASRVDGRPEDGPMVVREGRLEPLKAPER